MKRETTKKGPSTNKEQLRQDWIKCWKDMPQEKIQAWIERIPVHIQEIIACDGNNLYQEGRKKGQENYGFIKSIITLICPKIQVIAALQWLTGSERYNYRDP